MARYAVLVAAVVSLLATALLGFVIIPLLRRLHLGQTINEIGPKWHQDKQGIPTMGGFLFIIGSAVGLLAALPMLSGVIADLDPLALPLLILGLVTAVAFGAVGFADDYMKVTQKQNLGLRARQKLLVQGLIAAGFMITLHLMGRLPTMVQLPYFGLVDFGILYYPFAFLLIVGVVNAVNLTDGLDGLAGSVTLWVMCAYLLLLNLAEKFQLAVWAAALAGGCIGFLLWNFYPAKVFMGDTGSMFLGGCVVAIGFCMGRPDLIILLGLVYILEAFSVMIQVSYFKFTKWRTGTGKRVFKMTPIHHHFEMLGWGEVSIVALFSFVTLCCGVLAYIYVVVLG